MMSAHWDVVVVGLGAMGSAAVYHLARAGAQVLGIDQYAPPHNLGSSHGLSRIIREAYYEDPRYVPLLQRAYTLWADLEQRAEETLLTPTGGLMVGLPDQELVQGASHSAALHDLSHERLSAAQVQERFPAWQIPDDWEAVYEGRAGFLHPETCIRAHLQAAKAAGASLRLNTPLQSWEALPTGGYRLQVGGEYIEAAQVVFTAGAWLQELVPVLQPALTITRQVLYWFEPLQPALFTPEAFPIFILQDAPDHFVYGFPDDGNGFKIALHVPGQPLGVAADLSQQVAPEEIAAMQVIVTRYFPQAAGPLRKTAVCMYTNTADHHFAMGEYQSGLWAISPCSGHGFKFAAVIGEIAAQWVQGQTPAYDLSLFGLGRLIP
jgi:sarcosine oxidase